MDVRFTNQGTLQMYSEDNFPWRSTSRLAARHGEDSGAPAANRCLSDTKAPIGPKSGHTLVLKPQDEGSLLDFFSDNLLVYSEYAVNVCKCHMSSFHLPEVPIW